jgi:hypothetical protein
MADVLKRILEIYVSGKQYLAELPEVVPAHLVLVHNRVRPTRRFGARGFRAWLQSSDDSLVPCDCGWAAELGQHYRKRAWLTSVMSSSASSATDDG